MVPSPGRVKANTDRPCHFATCAEVGKSLVSLNEGILSCLGGDTDLRGQAEEVDSVRAREIGDRKELPLFPEQAIGKAWDIAHMDAGANDATTFADRFQCKWHQRAHRRKDDGRVERLGWCFVGSSCPTRPLAPGEGLGGDVTRPGEGKHRSPLPLRHLCHDVGRRAETVQSQLLAVACND